MRSARTKSAVAVVAAAAAAIGVLAVVPASAATAQPAVVSANPADFTRNVMDGQVNAIAQVGNTIVLGGQFTSVTSADGATTYNRTNLVAFNATTGAVSTTFAPVPSGVVEALAAGSRRTERLRGRSLHQHRRHHGQPGRAAERVQRRAGGRLHRHPRSTGPFVT